MKVSSVPLACPSCHAALVEEKEAARCTECGARYPFDEAGCPTFRSPDAFYEIEPVQWDHAGPRWLLPFVDAGITDFFARHIPREREGGGGGAILDAGCGAGLRFLAENYATVVGVDASPRRLAAARRIYAAAYLADCERLPFPDATFAAVVSVDVLEHIPAEVKDAVLSEWIRVTKPGGKILSVLDLDSRKPLHRWAARADFGLYHEYFIGRMGHHGLETATAAIGRFRRLGLRPVAEEATNRTIFQHPENFAWQFDPGFAGKSWFVRQLTRASYLIRRRPALRLAYGFFYAVWTRTIERLFPLDWAFNLAVCYETPPDGTGAPGPIPAG